LNRLNPPATFVEDDLSGGVESADQKVEEKEEAEPERGPRNQPTKRLS
jgi:hypothetical protein